MSTDTRTKRERKELIRLLILLAHLLFIVARIALQLDYLETSYSFYGWLLAMATGTDVIVEVEPATEEKAATEESAFFEIVRDALSEKTEGKLISDLDESHLWSLVLTEMKQPTRGEFEELARDGKLNLPYGAIDWTEESVGAHLGSLILGFRSAVADLLWLRVDEYWHQGRMEMMLPMMHTVVTLDPHFIEAWKIGAWHLAYNAAVTVETLEAKREFVQQGIVFLQDGIKRNPRNHELYFDLGFTLYFLKLEDYENAAHYIREADRYRPPEEKWIPRMLLLSYERAGHYEDALKGWRRYLTEIDPESLPGNRALYRLRALTALREQLEDEALAILEEMFDKFPGNAFADIGITKIRAMKAEAAGDLEGAKALWGSLIEKRHLTAWDEAEANIARLNMLIGGGGAATSESSSISN
jgi:tetratricopeptide (TPR) repeat protein